jgi:DNA-binding NarL/FixJ family response regulator
MVTSGVLIVEDDDRTRGRLQQIIGAQPGLRVEGVASSFRSADAHLRERGRPDVMLVDLGLPDGDGIDLIRRSRQHSPAPEVMVLSVFGDERHVLNAIEAGASGYLLKDADPTDIGDAILNLLAGGSPISAAIARHVLRRVQAANASAPARSEPSIELTDREHEVLELIARGCTYAEIAGLLFVSVNTVTSHIQHIYRKMEVRSRGEAVFEATQLGLLRMRN